MVVSGAPQGTIDCCCALTEFSNMSDIYSAKRHKNMFYTLLILEFVIFSKEYSFPTFHSVVTGSQD